MLKNPNHQDPQRILETVFGFDAFRPGQLSVIQHILERAHVLAVMPTGSGKSLCYQIPALATRQRAVVISPLVALMDDQVLALHALGVGAQRIHSNRTRTQNVDAWRQFQNKTATLLYLSPEALMQDRMLAALQRLEVDLFVIDEAHCVSKWGPSFRPDYEDLSRLSELFPDTVIAAFTATADKATRSDIVEKLTKGNAITIVQGFDRPNLSLAVWPKNDWKKQLLEFLDDKRASAGIVYCLSRKETERVAAFMLSHQFNAIPYHAGQDNDVRKINQDRFMTEPSAVMAATIAFGMGIDKPDIRFVVHTSLPANMETYYQEIGRAGRDGAPAETLVLYGLNDLYQRRRFIQQDGDDKDHQFREHKRLDALLAYCEASSCRRKTLLSYFGDDSDICGNCDNCLNPPRLIDGTNAAAMLISCVHQTGQSFGQAHIIDVVRGSNTQKILERGHHKIESFGTGQEYSKAFWQQFLRQLLAAGHLTVNIERYGRIEITVTGFALLRGDTTFEYQAIRESTGSKTPTSAKVPRDNSGIPTTDDDQALLAELKAKRLSLATAQGVPAFVVFSDATLIDMVNQKPQTRTSFAQINGVGPKKLAQYSDAFLALLTASES